MYFFALVAAAAALYFAYAAWQGPRPGVIVAAIVWLLYAIYEYFVASGVLCDANCNIRVDLILAWPLVWIATFFGIYAPGRWTVAGKVLGGLSAFILTSMVALSLYIVLVENPAAERAAQVKGCGGQGQPECPPPHLPEGSTAGAK
jgi:hypothetical protein